jgi:SPP1 gp7 family putative phage head morphogenesis protein
MLTEARRATIGFMARSLGIIHAAQLDGASGAEHDVKRLGQAAFGSFPPGVTMPHFGRLQPGALDRIIGNAGDGRPLGLLLSEIIPEHIDRVRDALASGVASGRPTREIAAEVAQQSGLTLSRASVIARTEIVRAQREAQREVMADPDGILGEWVWDAALDACASCQAQHGSIHPVTEIMASHPNCRCSMIPRPPSWAALGFDGIPDDRPHIEPGAVRFAGFPEATKLAILGPGKYGIYRTGEATLADFVTHTHSERWGPGTREATLAEALA